MSSILVGDVVYIGSRNVEPVRIVAYHVPTGKVVGQTELATGHSIQTLTADSAGRYLYAGILQKSTGPQPNLYRWDLASLSVPATPIGRIGDRDVRDLSVAPDGRLYAVGGGSPTAPALWEYNPATGLIANLGIPDAGATLARAVAATDETVFFGAGSTLGGGGSAGRACLHAYDRASRTFKQVTPAEMLADPSIRDLAILGDKLLVSSAGSTEQSKVALMDPKDPASYALATSIGKTAKNFAAIGGHVYFANESGLCAYSVASNSISQVDVGGPALGEIWGVDARDGKVLVTSAYGFIAEIDPVTGDSAVTRPRRGGRGLHRAGSHGPGRRRRLHLRRRQRRDSPPLHGNRGSAQPAGPGRGQGRRRRGRGVVHGPVQLAGNLDLRPGAAASRSTRPRTSRGPRTGRLTCAGTRRTSSCWSRRSRTPRAAGRSGPTSRRTGAKQCFVNPIDDVQLLRAVATRDGVAYLGGGLSSLEGAGHRRRLRPGGGPRAVEDRTEDGCRDRRPGRAGHGTSTG